MTFKVALIVLSDRAASGERADQCVPIMRERLGAAYTVVRESIISDDPASLQAHLIDLADSHAADLVLTSGGTGLSPRDRTPQATAAVLDYEVPGIAEAIRAASLAHTATAMLSRALAGVRDRTLVINLPGSPKAVAETLDIVLPVLPHALELLADRSPDQ
ncbi:MAG: MogA/MoaB family molybdenum cofactor biosynthesis protein [Candidatus Eremiobacteraeota bacterium]|nr:MogA/MoaB family molybdenum cofactor biosynthesis protein [Candidatus Eremiobacteraeota bacterium]MBV8499519.1 MogA/MoaB family molybdenum cofactor biosynthesis protein [Candidatus Eremiobacteraeota bacterium]